ncbi:hypothetical protein NM688_g3845 [Phlebia brevispora]|uniref:Uncharacterized protein n=1 Tax=Phlebia brevispora TaxID=194682 RepID=A0ACC1T4Q7_9APHY|nr:hypothetical protein NM688_g3845 [Phlebia brevispora]
MPTNSHTSRPNDDLADALRSVAKQLEEISSRISTTPVLRSEVARQKDSNDKDSYDKASGYTAEAMEEELWKTTRDTIQEQNQVEIDSWKDELNNLLVFAGLFSAVVTAFTVESYTWLQQDPGDVTNTFLAHISLQISSFNNTPSFINSSAPALPLRHVTSAFTPAAIAVPVNTLWILSLMLSLLSAFFAIAVQQWLRRLRLPADIPVRRAVELLTLRADGLKTWQVPGIISLLPLLLQVAVILFLIGLLILLDSLNVTVLAAFSYVAELGLITFLMFTFIPLFRPNCPYKSPLVPTVLVALQWLSYPLVSVAATFFIPFGEALTTRKVSDFFSRRSYRIWRFLECFKDANHLVISYLIFFDQYMFVDMGQFWLRREYQHLLTLDDTTSSELGHSSVARILLMHSHPSFIRLISCMRHFSLDGWRSVYRAMTVHSLNVFLPRFELGGLINMDGNVVPRASLSVRKWLSSRHLDLSQKAHEARNWKQDGELSDEDHDSLVLSFELDKYGSRRYMQYAKYLFHICGNQTTDEEVCWLRESITPLLILKAFNAGYAPKADEACKVVSFATKHGTRDAVRRNAWDNDVHRMLFASCTAALVAMTHHPSILQEQGRQLLHTFSDILCDDVWERKHMEKLKLFYTGHPEDDLMCAFQQIPGIHRTLCRTLVKLAKKGVLLQDPACPSIRLAWALLEIYEDIDKQDINYARQCLHEFSERIPCNAYLVQWERERRAARLQESQEAPVPSEGDATPAHVPSLHTVRDEVRLSEHDEPTPREEARTNTGSRVCYRPAGLLNWQSLAFFLPNSLSPNNADARRESAADHHEGISTSSAYISIAEEIGMLAETHADHTLALAPTVSGSGGIQPEQDILNAPTRPTATDDLVDLHETTQVKPLSTSDKQESESNDCPDLSRPAHTTASSLSQPHRDSQMPKLRHSASTASLLDDLSTLSASLTLSQTDIPRASASSPSDAINNINVGLQDADSHDATRFYSELEDGSASVESTMTNRDSNQPDPPQVPLQLGALTSLPSDAQPASSDSISNANGVAPCDILSTAVPQHYDDPSPPIPNGDRDKFADVSPGVVAVPTSPAAHANTPVAAHAPDCKDDMPASGELPLPAPSSVHPD